MLYLFLDKNKVVILAFKKSFLGQYETSVFSKSYQSDLLEKGRVIKTDYIASAVKEGLRSLNPTELKERETFLILPQESFIFLRFEVPSDVAPSALDSFIRDKVRSDLSVNLEEFFFDYFLEIQNSKQHIQFFAIEKISLTKYQEALNLIDLNIKALLPETIAYFTLFKKTLRRDKKENIFFVSYDLNRLTGLLFDSCGLLSCDKWTVLLETGEKAEDLLKSKSDELSQKGIKLNRIILAGDQSQNVRQDTFTKAVGIWTNPLKRIIPEFYDEYLKILLTSTNKPFSFLSNEACLGAFIFFKENKTLPFSKKGKLTQKKIVAFPQINMPKKEIVIFFASLIVSLVFFLGISKLSLYIKLPSISTKKIAKISPTNIPTPKTSPVLSPTPPLNKWQLKIKVLNGSGTTGKAGEVKNLLLKKGYQEIITGNADSFDYDQTILKVKKSKKEAAILIKKDLVDHLNSFKEETLAESEIADIIIIIGKNFP